MRLANQLIRDIRLDTIATCCYLELDPANATGTGVLAGHPPPIMRDGDRVDLLPLPADPPLGATRKPTYHDTVFALPAGATLLLYTDGLVEDHQHPIDLGLSQLRTAMHTAPNDEPSAVLDHILRSELGPQPRRDDVALLCLVTTTADEDC